MPTVNLSSKAKKDLRRMDPPVRRRVLATMAELEKDPVPDNLDIVPLVNSAPYLRLRSGGHRILYRPGDEGDLLVARVVPRGELDEAVRNL